MTTRQIVMQFGLDNVSNAVRGAWDNANYEAWFDVVHLTEPNIDRVNGKLNSRNKAFKSVYFELSETVTSSFCEAGFDGRRSFHRAGRLTGKTFTGVTARE
jgi:hypothetical protein